MLLPSTFVISISSLVLDCSPARRTPQQQLESFCIAHRVDQKEIFASVRYRVVMQGLDLETVDSATLVCRIVELEHERDELRRNAEHAPALQTAIFGGLDLVSRIQGRRTTGLEQDLVTCEQKLSSLQKENTKLQEELSEAYTIKSKFADLLNAEVEKSNGLEKEVKYFQNQVASAFYERDRTLSEIGRFQRKKTGLIEKITELQDRLDHVTSEYAEEKSLCEVLYSKLEKLKDENNLYKEVAERFWRVREQVCKSFNSGPIQDRAAILLQDPEEFWSYGETNVNLPNNQSKEVKGNYLLVCDTFSPDLQEKENHVRKQVGNTLSCDRQQMFCFTDLVQKELRQLSSFRRSVKEDVTSFLSKEKDLIMTLQKALRLIINVQSTQTEDCISFNAGESKYSIVEINHEEISEADTKFSCSRATSEDEETASANEFMEMAVENSEGVTAVSENKGESAEHFSIGEAAGAILEGAYRGSESVPSTDDSKVLAQALQEKVSALLLLSQQEERHILESNTAFAMESQISLLKQQLLQVTTEKMDALVKLACIQEKCLKLQEQEKVSKKFGQKNRSSLSRSVEESIVHSNSARNLLSSPPTRSSGYLKSFLWPRGLGVHTKSLSHMLSLNRGKEDDAINSIRLRAENAVLRESLSSIGHLCKSVNRLRQTIDRIAVQSNVGTEYSAEEMDGVISEALHLKVAFKQLPHHYNLGWDSIGSPLTKASSSSEMEFQGASDGETSEDLDIVSTFGLETVRLLLLAAHLQKRLLKLS